MNSVFPHLGQSIPNHLIDGNTRLMSDTDLVPIWWRTKSDWSDRRYDPHDR